MPSEYRFRRRVQFYETDAAGIVHFSWYFRYMEEAEHALWREAGLSIHARDSEIGWPRVADVVRLSQRRCASSRSSTCSCRDRGDDEEDDPLHVPADATDAPTEEDRHRQR